jgi:hypothetical protein
MTENLLLSAINNLTGSIMRLEQRIASLERVYRAQTSRLKKEQQPTVEQPKGRGSKYKYGGSRPPTDFEPS